MINLLPNNAKKKIRREYQLRLTVVVLWMVFGLEVFTFLLFMPSYLILSFDTNAVASNLEQKKLVSPVENNEIPARLAVIKKELLLLKSPSDVRGIPPSQLISDVLSNKPRGIEFNGVALAQTTGALAMQLSGTAETREALLALQKAFKTPQVDSVKFGSSFITKKSPIDFTVTVTFKNKIN